VKPTKKGCLSFKTAFWTLFAVTGVAGRLAPRNDLPVFGVIINSANAGGLGWPLNYENEDIRAHVSGC